jgi:peptidoglycan/xylan/chitin deacetylase (PgdA/CDA1 family)
MNRKALYRAGLNVLHYSGLARMAAPFFSGVGAIFMLHHVRPARGSAEGFAPNAGLEITPEFLDAVIGYVRMRGFRLLSLEQAADELRAGRPRQHAPFAVFTLDDGYRDNLRHALPVFEKHACPFTVFVSTAYADGRGELWWDILEQVIARHDHVRPLLEGLPEEIATVTDEDKQAAWDLLYPHVRWRLGEHEQRRWARRFASAHGVDVEALCRAEVMNWQELAELAGNPLCTIGAHTVHHYALARLEDAEEALREMTESRERLEAELGLPVRTFAYPYGDPRAAGVREFLLAEQAGFACAVTTRKGLIHAEDASRLMALSRVSLNGQFQDLRYVEVLLTGVPFALAGRLAS